MKPNDPPCGNPSVVGYRRRFDRLAAAPSHIGCEMSEMVERVAKHIALALAEAHAEREVPEPDDFRKAARAAIEAMQEPTEAMVEAGDETLADCARRHWEAMIDEALK
jgi:hypothetical protein